MTKNYGFVVPLHGGADYFVHLRDLLDPAAKLREREVITFHLAAFNGKTKASRVARATPEAYAAVVKARHGRVLSADAAAAEIAKLRDLPLPPKEGDTAFL